MEDRTEVNNVYARTPEGIEIHISQAASGKQGYFCLGCEKELQAVHSKTGRTVDYFRHDPEAVKSDKKCAYRDIEHRNGLAIRSLMRTKQIMVPSIFKFPPKGMDGFPYQLQESKLVEATEMIPNLTFYEDAEGLVDWTSQEVPDDAIELAKAAITLFDDFGKPILLVVMSGPKMTTKKRVGLKRLGIDVVRISVPRDVPEKIERIFEITANTNWIYSNEEDNTSYDIQLSSSSAAAILNLDPNEGGIFEESFYCRKAEIGNLIRTVERCLGSKPYANVADGLRKAINEVGRFIERDQRRLELVGDRIRTRIQNAYHAEEGEATRNLELAEANVADLERRYLAKASEIAEEQGVYDATFRTKEVEGFTGEGAIERRRIELDSEARGIENEIRRVEAELESIRVAESTLGKEFAELKKQEQSRFERDKRRLLVSIERDKTNRDELLGSHESASDEIRRKFEGLQNEIVGQVGRRDQSGDSEFSRAIRGFVDGKKLVEDWCAISPKANRARTARNAFKEGTYKNWYPI